MSNEKDCQDQYFECAGECSTDDKECHNECVTDLKECDIPAMQSNHWQPVSKSPIIDEDTTEYDSEGDLIAELLCITSELGGTMERIECLNSQGKSSKVIRIEYDVKHKDET